LCGDLSAVRGRASIRGLSTRATLAQDDKKIKQRALLRGLSTAHGFAVLLKMTKEW
jgi:hypothetical protein